MNLYPYFKLLPEDVYINMLMKVLLLFVKTFEPPHGKSNNLHRRNQRRRSASQ